MNKIIDVAIIPARYGSTRIKKKNLKQFCGKPLIYYAIKKAIQSKCFDKVIVSTDSFNIKKIAEKYGAEVPFLRPKHLSRDVPTEDVIIHATKFLIKKGYRINMIATIEPPAMGRKIIHIKKAFEILKKKKSYDSVMTVVKVSERPEWMIKSENNIVKPIYPYFFYKKKPFLKYPSSKEFLPIYKAIAIIYLIKFNALLKYKSCTGIKCYPLKVKNNLNIDLDWPEDWKKSEKICKKLKILND
jgi:CMP-N,N'-diacetyllegionaminic acid synthase